MFFNHISTDPNKKHPTSLNRSKIMGSYSRVGLLNNVAILNIGMPSAHPYEQKTPSYWNQLFKISILKFFQSNLSEACSLPGIIRLAGQYFKRLIVSRKKQKELIFWRFAKFHRKNKKVLNFGLGMYFRPGFGTPHLV